MSDFKKESALAQTIYAELCQIDGVDEFLDSMSEELTERVIDDIKETLALYGHMLAPESESQKQEEDPEKLRFASACELDGPKHPEYVKGWEAAMDAVCASRNSYPIDTGKIWSVVRDAMIKGRHLGNRFWAGNTEEYHAHIDAESSSYADKIAELFEDFAPSKNHEIGEVVVTKTEDGQIVAVTRQDEEGRMLSVIAESDQEHAAPVRTSDRLPTEADADFNGNVWVSHKGDWRLVYWYSAVLGAKAYSHWQPTGLRKPEEPGGE